LDIDPEFLGILTLRGLATGDDRPMIIYNGALDMAGLSKSCVSSAAREIGDIKTELGQT
jgi:hypothetical protein